MELKAKSNCCPVLGAATIHENKQEGRIHLGKQQSGTCQRCNSTQDKEVWWERKRDLGRERNKDVYLCNTQETRERRVTGRYGWAKPTEWTVSFRHNTRSERRWTTSLHGSLGQGRGQLSLSPPAEPPAHIMCLWVQSTAGYLASGWRAGMRRGLCRRNVRLLVARSLFPLGSLTEEWSVGSEIRSKAEFASCLWVCFYVTAVTAITLRLEYTDPPKNIVAVKLWTKPIAFNFAWLYKWTGLTGNDWSLMSLVARQQVSTQFETLTKTVRLTATTVCCTAQIIHCCCKFITFWIVFFFFFNVLAEKLDWTF